MPSKNDSDEDTASTEETKEEEVKPEKDEEETRKPTEGPAPKAEEKAEESEDIKKDEEELRKVIKVDSAEEGEKEQKEPIKDDIEETPRESLEQKRAIFQSIKDFDFLIKKNQEDIGEINQKLESLTKDLDDLVSLYEIVSEQMNPFVGLSKVTKKRIDALENFTKEIEDLKERTGELESFAERSGAKFKRLSEMERRHVKTIDTDALLAEGDAGEKKESVGEVEGTGEVPEEKTSEPATETIAPDSNVDITAPEETPDEETQQPTSLEEIALKAEDSIIAEEISTDELQQPMPTITIDNKIWDGLSDDDLDIILERSLGVFSPEGKIDMIIDEFIESLKG